MGQLEQARLSRSRPWGGCSDDKCWCSTVMRYKYACGGYVTELTFINIDMYTKTSVCLTF